MLILTRTLGPMALHPLQRRWWKLFQVKIPSKMHLLTFEGRAKWILGGKITVV